MSVESGFLAIAGGLILATVMVLGGNKPTKERYSDYQQPSVPLLVPGQFKTKLPLNPETGSTLNYQLFQQAVNAATPTMQQLSSISGNGVNYGSGDHGLNDGGINLFNNDYQAVNLGSDRAQSISACAQNAPTFIATDLLPKPTIPGMNSWDINAPNSALANQNFLSAVGQMGVDTTLSSRRNQSRDIRGTIPNPINTVSPWNNSDILPDLTRRPLECFIPQESSLYTCNGPSIP